MYVAEVLRRLPSSDVQMRLTNEFQPTISFGSFYSSSTKVRQLSLPPTGRPGKTTGNCDEEWQSYRAFVWFASELDLASHPC
jgi:hypothetical protein